MTDERAHPDSQPSEAYQVVARRFRPKSFGEVVGQDAVLATLRTALESGRVPHALLFSGSRGVGKTTSARILARALNCETNGPSPDPCGVCPACVAILQGSHPDVVEIDAASHNLVDDIRELRESVAFASMGARYKVYILDEVHMLTRNAFNAFLKTLEEPPANVVFVLATTELHKVPDTIRSRCQILRFRRVGEVDMVERLRAIVRSESSPIDDAVLREIAATARGGMRDAETLLERVLPLAAATEGGGVFGIEEYRRVVHRVGFGESLATIEKLLGGDAAAGLHFAASVADSGVDEREALGELVDVLRDLLLIKLDGAETSLVQHAAETRESLTQLAAPLETWKLDAMIQAGLNGRDRIRRIDDRRLALELALVRMAGAGSLPELGALAAGLSVGGAPLATAPAAAASVGGAMPTGVPAAPAAQGLKAQLLERLQQVKPILVATIERCVVEGPDGRGGVQIVPAADMPRMHLDRLSAPGVVEALSAELSKAAGCTVRAHVATPSAGAGGAEQRPAARGRKPAAEDLGPATRRVKEHFHGEVVRPDNEEQGT